MQTGLLHVVTTAAAAGLLNREYINLLCADAVMGTMNDGKYREYIQ